MLFRFEYFKVVKLNFWEPEEFEEPEVVFGNRAVGAPASAVMLAISVSNLDPEDMV